MSVISPEIDSPFSEYKATELPQDKINQFFVQPKYIAKMFNNSVSFIIGQRGTGKTTLLKYLCSSYNQNDGKEKERLGVYYRFDINKMHSFSGAALNDEEWAALFAHCFSIEICIELVNLLLSLRNEYPIKNETYICTRIRNFFFDLDDVQVKSLEDLLKYLEQIQHIANKYKRNPFRAPQPMISECEKSFEEFCSLINKEDSFKGTCIHFLFDEYENMLDYQKEFINSCAKNASYFHTYKICVRPYGNDNAKTKIGSELLNEADDFKTIDYLTDIIGDPDDIAEFMRKACSRRLQEYYQKKRIAFDENDLAIDSYFPVSKSDDELFEIISSNQSYVLSISQEVSKLFSANDVQFQKDWSLFQMKLLLVLSKKRGFNFFSVINSIKAKDKKYKDWVNNYKKAILFQCFLDLDQHYIMSGFEDVIGISGNIVRYVLEVCDYSFLCTNYTSDGKFSAISEKMQTEAIYKVSQRRFQQISTIADYGQEIKQMVLALGIIFRFYHKDAQIKRFEPNHFSIVRSKLSIGANEDRINEAIKLSIMHGALTADRSTKNRDSIDTLTSEDEDYHLHPILTPYFNISWRRKQKCRFTLDEINTLLFGSDMSVSRLLQNYCQKTNNQTSDGQQISFADLKKENY